MTRQMLSIFEADAQHKATLRERLKGQDEAIGKVLEATGRLERRFEQRPWPGGSRP